MRLFSFLGLVEGFVVVFAVGFVGFLVSCLFFALCWVGIVWFFGVLFGGFWVLLWLLGLFSLAVVDLVNG
jgi:hypothetical protein